MAEEVSRAAKLQWYWDNPDYFMEEVLKIRDRNGLIVPLALKPAQRVFHNILEKQREEFGRDVVENCRELIVKMDSLLSQLS